MKVLVISDIHLKPWIIETADQMMEKHAFDNAIFLGDFADDWDQERNIDLYIVGHTPVDRPEYREKDGILMTDVFSTYRDGRPIGTNRFVWVDSETKEWGEI